MAIPQVSNTDVAAQWFEEVYFTLNQIYKYEP